MTGVLLGELRGDEGPRVNLQHILAEPVLKVGEELPVAENEPGVEQRGANGHVRQAQADALGDGARGMADFEAEIPQQIEDVFGDALAPRRLLVGKQEQEIDVGARREQAAAIAALRDHGHTLGGGRIFSAVDVLGGEVVGEADQRILEIGEPGRAGAPVTVLFKLLLGGDLRLMDERLQIVDQRGAELRILPDMGARNLPGLLAQEIEVEIRGWFRCGLVHGGRRV